MPFILAIDPDKRQSTQLAAVVKTQLQAELVHRATAADALEALKGRVPDLVLTSSLISPREDAALAAHLRDLGAAAAHVQTITIPLLGSAAPERAKGVLAALRREKPQTAMTDGCAPDVFAEQIRQYLRTADEQKAAAAGLAEEPVAEVELEPAVVAEAIAVETASEPEPEPGLEAVAIAGEPERLPLPQLLQLVSDRTTTPGAPTSALSTAPLADEPAQLEAHASEPAAVEAQAAEEWNDEQVIDELARQLPPPSLVNGMPPEASVPVVEIRTFETLDAIASQLAAAPLPQPESLDDLASLFAATPTLPHAGPLASGFDTPAPVRRHEFESLFAQPSAESAAPIEVPGIDPNLFAASAPPPRGEVVVAESVLHEPAPVEPELEHVLAESALPEFEVLEPAAAEWQHEAAVDRSWAPAAAKPLDDEIALDVDGFDPAVMAPAAEPATPATTSFSFTFVDGFGDAWSDFDVPPVSAAAPATAPEPEPAVAAVLDDEALSLIGDAAHQASFDALVIEEFERRGGRKAKPTKTHAGATQVVPAATVAVKKKAPAQDEWGFFDPEQCGFAALDDEEAGDRRPARDSNTRVRVISY